MQSETENYSLEYLKENKKFVCPCCGKLHDRKVDDAASYTIREHDSFFSSLAGEESGSWYKVLVCKTCARRLTSYTKWSTIIGIILGVGVVIGASLWFAFSPSSNSAPIIGFFILGYGAYWLVRKLIWRVLFKKDAFRIDVVRRKNAIFNNEL